MSIELTDAQSLDHKEHRFNLSLAVSQRNYGARAQNPSLVVS